jgi:hypothetical protein
MADGGMTSGVRKRGVMGQKRYWEENAAQNGVLGRISWKIWKNELSGF